MDNDKPKRRTKWQAIAHKRYPRMLRLGGDGDTTGWEAWCVMSKCPREGTRHWCYVLRPDYTEAAATLAKWNTERCGPQCQGAAQHSLWRIRE